MIVVADTSPLVALVNVQHIDVLPRLFGAVLIPPAVLTELVAPPRPPAVRAFAGQPPVWLEVRSPARVEAIPGLHPGEAEALSLAAEVQADLVLLDEKEGRRIATERHLLVAGTIGVLERAAAERLLNLREAFDRLRATDFWVSPALLDARLAAFEQGQARAREPGIGR
jgi:predicted nucleic acid-binding protein